MVTITLKLFNGDILEYVTDSITDPRDGIKKVKFFDHIDNLRDLVLRHLNLSKTYAIRFFHPNESEEMFSLYFHLYETDKLFKTKISLLSLYRDIWDKTNDNENNENNEKSFIGNIMSMIQENNDVVPNEVSYEYSRDEQFKMSSAMLGLFSTFIPTVDIIPKDSDPKEYIKNQLSDTSSVLYLAMSAEFIKRKVYTQDIKLDVFVDDVFPNI